VASTDLTRKIGRIPQKLQAVPSKLEQFVRAAVADPKEVALYLPEYVSERFAYPVGYVIEEEWEARLHRMLGAPWPCPERSAVDELWSRIIGEVRRGREQGS
jgi:hypothetical protein